MAATGSSFGPYEILAPLGRGGMGQVYRAWDPRLEREVALKILHARADTDPDRVRQFVGEARAASALNHPNILTVFDAAVDGATPYIVSELIEGESLRDLIRRGPIPLKRVLDLGAQIADGLSNAHAAGIVHRDLKPENIMVTRAARAKILDFGLAQPLGPRTSGATPADLDGQTATEPGLLAGTLPYMSPEQARGAHTDFRSDQFAFGLILYELITGRPAFRRDSPAETLDVIMNAEPVPVPTLSPSAPLMLTWIVERCLAKHPEDRYGATSDLERDLRTLRDRLGDVVARDDRTTQAPRARSVALYALPTLLGLALLILGAVLWRVAPDLRQPDLTSLQFTPFATEDTYKAYPAWSPNGQTVAYVAAVDGVLQVFTRGRHSSTGTPITSALADCKHPFWSPDGRGIYYISLAQTREAIWWVPAAGEADLTLENAYRGAISPDGTTLAFLRDDVSEPIGSASIWLTGANGTGEPTRYDRPPFGDLRFMEAALSFSPDGRWLGVSGVPATLALEPERRGWQFWLLPTGEGAPHRLFAWWPNVAPRVSSFSWMPDSRHIVIGMIPMGTSGSDLWMADVEHDRAWPVTRSAIKASYPSVSPSGEEVVFMSDEPHYDVVEVPLDGGPLRTLVTTSRNETDPSWSPVAKAYVYVTDRAGQDEIWLRTGDGPLGERPLVTQANFNDRTVMLASPSFSPDGRRIAYQRNASRPVWPLRIWYSAVAGGMAAPLLPESHASYQGPPTWSPDGEWLAFAAWDTRQWKLMKVRLGGTDPVTLHPDGAVNATPQWSPTGEWITWETDEDFLIVAASDGREQRRLGIGAWLAHTWSEDGTRIYGIRQTDELRLALFVVNPRDGTQRMVADLAPSPPVNNQLKGLTLGPDGRTLVTSIPRMRGDLWLLQNLRPPRGVVERIWRRNPS